jgi:serine/threonine-protein kinase
MFRLHTFGGCFVTHDGARFDLLSGHRKGLALLAMIAASGERGASRDTVLAYLWPDSDEPRARTSLKQLVHSLRQQSGAPTMLLSSATLRLNPDVIASDVDEFRDAIRRGDHEAAVRLYAGPFLDGFYLRGIDGFERWAAAERAPLARDFARALEALAEHASASGDPSRSVEWWRRLAETEPLSARAATGLMLALDAAGERAAALQHARSHEQVVRDELGVAPDPTVTDLASRLQAPVNATRRAPIAAPRAPNDLRRVDGAATTPVRDPRASIAVLPFANTGGDPSDQPLVDGLTDELIAALGKIPGLKVTGRTSTFALGGRGLGAREVARTLGVATVLEGSVRRSGARLKVSAQLVSAEDDGVLWTETYARELSDVFALQEEIAQAIVGALRVKLRRPSGGSGQGRLVGRPPASLEAYELYLKGRYVWYTRFSGDALTLALSYFEQAAALDPLYARAYAGISDAHALLAIFGYTRASEGFTAAKTAAHRALALDDSLAEAHVSLAHVLFVHDFAWDASERSFRRAIDLDPASPTAHSFFAVCLQDQARFDEAIVELQTARSIDPLSSHVGNLVGRVYVNARRADDAIRALRDALELNPHSDLAYQQLGHAYLHKSMTAEALAAFRQAAALSGPRDTAHLAYALAVTGDHAQARRLLNHLCDGSAHADRLAFHIAMAQAGLGDVDEAFRWLERGFADRAAFMDGVRVTPAFDVLHGDPRWASLLGRMGLRWHHEPPAV